MPKFTDTISEPAANFNPTTPYSQTASNLNTVNTLVQSGIGLYQDYKEGQARATEEEFRKNIRDQIEKQTDFSTPRQEVVQRELVTESNRAADLLHSGKVAGDSPEGRELGKRIASLRTAYDQGRVSSTQLNLRLQSTLRDFATRMPDRIDEFRSIFQQELGMHNTLLSQLAAEDSALMGEKETEEQKKTDMQTAAMKAPVELQVFNQDGSINAQATVTNVRKQAVIEEQRTLARERAEAAQKGNAVDQAELNAAQNAYHSGLFRQLNLLAGTVESQLASLEQQAITEGSTAKFEELRNTVFNLTRQAQRNFDLALNDPTYDRADPVAKQRTRDAIFEQLDSINSFYTEDDKNALANNIRLKEMLIKETKLDTLAAHQTIVALNELLPGQALAAIMEDIRFGSAGAANVGSLIADELSAALTSSLSGGPPGTQRQIKNLIGVLRGQTNISTLPESERADVFRKSFEAAKNTQSLQGEHPIKRDAWGRAALSTAAVAREGDTEDIVAVTNQLYGPRFISNFKALAESNPQLAQQVAWTTSRTLVGSVDNMLSTAMDTIKIYERDSGSKVDFYFNRDTGKFVVNIPERKPKQTVYGTTFYIPLTIGGDNEETAIMERVTGLNNALETLNGLKEYDPSLSNLDDNQYKQYVAERIAGAQNSRGKDYIAELDQPSEVISGKPEEMTFDQQLEILKKSLEGMTEEMRNQQLAKLGATTTVAQPQKLEPGVYDRDGKLIRVNKDGSIEEL